MTTTFAWEKYSEFDEPCHWVSGKGEEAVVSDFLYGKNGAPKFEPSIRDRAHRIPLHRAANFNQTHLLDIFADVRTDFESTDRVGPISDYFSSFLILVQLGWTPLFYAACSGHVEMAKSLLKNGCKANTIDVSGGNCLHVAASNGQPEIIGDFSLLFFG